MELKDSEVKDFCARFYESDLVNRLLGGVFHPGGEELTVKLGEEMGLESGMHVLDVACGPGASGRALASRFDCTISGVDLSEDNLASAVRSLETAGARLGRFVVGDAESLPFEDELFDAVVCECALCTFPNRESAMSEMYRVLKEGGSVGLTDVTIEERLPSDLRTMVSHAACIAGATDSSGYISLMEGSEFKDVRFIDASESIVELVERVSRLIEGWDAIEDILGCDLEQSLGLTPKRVEGLIERGLGELEKGNIGYGMFIGVKR